MATLGVRGVPYSHIDAGRQTCDVYGVYGGAFDTEVNQNAFHDSSITPAKFQLFLYVCTVQRSSSESLKRISMSELF